MDDRAEQLIRTLRELHDRLDHESAWDVLKELDLVLSDQEARELPNEIREMAADVIKAHRATLSKEFRRAVGDFDGPLSPPHERLY